MSIAAHKGKFLEALEVQFRENLKRISSLRRAIHEKAWDHFLELGLPEKKQEGFEYIPLSQLYANSFTLPPPAPSSLTLSLLKEQLASLIYPECQSSHVVFVNGQYFPELSDISGLPKQMLLLGKEEAFSHYGHFLHRHVAKALEGRDPFVALNLALTQKGLFLYVPPKITVEKPLQCIYLIAHEQPVILSPMIYLFMGAHAQLKMMTTVYSDSQVEYFSNGVLDVHLEEGALLEQMGLLNPSKQRKDKEGQCWYFESLRATLKASSHLTSHTCTLGAKTVRQNFLIALEGQSSRVNLRNLSLLKGNRQAHASVFVDHKAPHSESMQLFKNVLEETSRSSFEGKIYVHPAAQKTQAYQLNNNLLLSDRVIANSKPNLEIFADDVKASHGSTASQLRKDHLFYMRTRGIPLELAKTQLIFGFCFEFLKHLSPSSLQEEIEQLMREYLQ